MTDGTYWQACCAELGRLGLSPADVPYDGLAETPEGAFLEHLRSLQPGAGWRDVFPELGLAWRPGDPVDTADGPVGPFDQPVPPRGTRISAVLEPGVDPSLAELLIAQLRARGCPIYGYGVEGSAATFYVLVIVLDVSAPANEGLEAGLWLEAQPGVGGFAIGRLGPNDEAA